MIQGVTITSMASPMPGYFNIVVKAQVIKPASNATLKAGFPTATLTGGTMQGPVLMNPDGGAPPNGYVSMFTGPAGNYSASVTANWIIPTESGPDSGSCSSTSVP
jgi:hypothetical protein